MSIDVLKDRLPEYARDIKLNLSSLASEQLLSPQQKAGSFIGLSPSEDSTGKRWQLGPVDKHGSPRLRFWCVEAAWRLLKFQPNYRGVLWARDKLRDANQSRAKQISVALARRFFVDWWRVRTGRITAAELGFTFQAAT